MIFAGTYVVEDPMKAASKNLSFQSAKRKYKLEALSTNIFNYSIFLS